MSANAPVVVVRGMEPPGFVGTTWAVLVGYVVSLLLLGPAWIGFALLGLIWHSGTTGADPKGLGNWPYLANGLWAGATNVAVAGAVLGFVAWRVACSIRRRAGVAVSAPFVFALLVGVGYAFARARPHAPLALPWLLAAAAIALAVGHVPAAYLTWSPRPRRRVVVAAGVAVAVVCIAYPLTHPLRFEALIGVPSSQPSAWQTGVVFIQGRAGEVRYFSVTVQNPGFMRPVLTGGSLELRGPRAFELVGVDSAVWPYERTTLLHRLVVPARADRSLTFFVRLRGCGGLHGTAVVSRIVLRYRTLGRAFSEPIPVRPAPAVRCP